MIYGHMQLVKWMKTIGFYSPKHLNKFKLWQERNSKSKRMKVLSAVQESKNMGALETPPIARGGFEIGIQDRTRRSWTPPIRGL